MSLYWKWFFLILAGVASGAMTCMFLLGMTQNREAFRPLGKWFLMPNLARPQGGLWDKAWGMRHAPLALSPNEAIYLGRKRDDAGEEFKEGCIYKVSGQRPAAAWWSFTIYDEEGFLPASFERRFSLTAAELKTDSWEFHIANTSQGSSWLTSKGAGRFSLMMRLYRLDKDKLDPQMLPRIEKLTCKAAST
jgi:hypothetical protein